MEVNKKKRITLKNNTNYFIPDKDKIKVHFSSSESYQNRNIKIEAYETRLYYQYKYCEDNNGQTFFYTLTYNDEHMPKYCGFNCFDYEDLRDLLTGGFRKQLLRKYGTKFKYFVGAELGDGKGERGLHNNPHYHILFFLENANDRRFPYVKIEPLEFRHLVREYWQGHDESVDGFKDYREFRYGVAKEGENDGLVTDFRACCYCAKYVCKDVKLKLHETDVEKFLRLKYTSEYKYSNDSYREFFYNKIYDIFNTPLDAKKTKWSFDDFDLINYLVPNYFELPKEFYKDIVCYIPCVSSIINKYGLWEEYFQFVREQIEPKVKDGINEYRNRYCNKCRVSQGIGEYALKDIDILNPSVKVPSKDGFKNRPIGMYYYRKLYTDVVKDKRTGQNLYVLNQDGINYKLNKLPSQITKKLNKSKNDLMIVLGNKDLYEKMKKSDINTTVSMTFDEFFKKTNYLLVNNKIDEILRRYAEYKLVYEDRFFQVNIVGDNSMDSFPSIDVMADYNRFIQPSYYYVDRNDIMLDSFLENTPENYLPYYSHPYFLRYQRLFAVLDMCSDYWFVQDDDKAQREAEQIAETKRFHDRRKLKEFYGHFGL